MERSSTRPGGCDTRDPTFTTSACSERVQGTGLGHPFLSWQIVRFEFTHCGQEDSGEEEGRFGLYGATDVPQLPKARPNSLVQDLKVIISYYFHKVIIHGPSVGWKDVLHKPQAHWSCSGMLRVLASLRCASWSITACWSWPSSQQPCTQARPRWVWFPWGFKGRKRFEG